MTVMSSGIFSERGTFSAGTYKSAPPDACLHGTLKRHELDSERVNLARTTPKINKSCRCLLLTSTVHNNTSGCNSRSMLSATNVSAHSPEMYAACAAQIKTIGVARILRHACCLLTPDSHHALCRP